MHNLEQLITEWRETLSATPGIGPEMLDELENHLRETLDPLLRSGVPETEAFQRAVAQLGSPSAISSEFQKLNQPLWLPVKITAGFGVAAALALAIFVLPRLHGHGSGFLLASHVFALTLGYVTVLLTGALGICFVCQRCFSEFCAVRLQSLSRISFLFASLAAGLTAVGIVLGMLWARTVWGRWWGWDPKETAALSVLLWSVCFLSVHRWRRATARVVLLMSILGNVIVSLAWLGPYLLAGAQTYGTSKYSLVLLAGILPNLAFFLMGLAPVRLRPTSV